MVKIESLTIFLLQRYRLALDQDQYVQPERKQVLGILNYQRWWNVPTMRMDYLLILFLWDNLFEVVIVQIMK